MSEQTAVEIYAAAIKRALSVDDYDTAVEMFIELRKAEIGELAYSNARNLR